MRIAFIFFAAVGLAQMAAAQETYVVQPGDTLLTIAQTELGTVRAWKEICDLNKLTDCDRILAGMTLELPFPGAAAVDTTPAIPTEPAIPRQIVDGPADSTEEAAPTKVLPDVLPIKSAMAELLPNEALEGASIGVVGKDGSLPTGWSVFNVPTVSVQNITTEKGKPTIHIRLQGTPTASNALLNFSSSQAIPVSPLIEYQQSFDAQIVGGNVDNIENIRPLLGFRSQDGALLQAVNTGDWSIDLLSGLTRVENVGAASDPNTAFVTPGLQFLFGATPPGPIDITLKLRGMSLVSE